MRYEHTQPAHLLRAVMIAFGLAPTGAMLLFVPYPEAESAFSLIVGSTFVLMAVLTILFWSLTVRIDNETLEWQFGPGPIGKRIPLRDIDSCQPTHTSFYHGWGIHWTPGGWVYNVSGYGAVRIRLKSGKTLLLGTDEPETLAEAIRQALPSSSRRARRAT